MTVGLVAVVAELLVMVTVKIGGHELRAIEIDPAMRDEHRIDDYIRRRHDTLGWLPHPVTPA